MIHSTNKKKEDTYFHTCLKTESSRGCNQVAFALQHFLVELKDKISSNEPSTIHIFSNSCYSQNKNSVVMFMFIAFLEKSKKFSQHPYVYPIRGHIRGSLRKFLDTQQLSTIIEILPLHFIKVLSLSIYATSHPSEPRFEALAPVTVIRCT